MLVAVAVLEGGERRCRQEVGFVVIVFMPEFLFGDEVEAGSGSGFGIAAVEGGEVGGLVTTTEGEAAGEGGIGEEPAEADFADGEVGFAGVPEFGGAVGTGFDLCGASAVVEADAGVEPAGGIDEGVDAGGGVGIGGEAGDGGGITPGGVDEARGVGGCGEFGGGVNLADFGT